MMSPAQPAHLATIAIDPVSIPTAPRPLAPLVVLDTNVVLDWLVFRDVATAALREAIEGGSLQWIATAAMRAELLHVLTRPALAAWEPDGTGVWSAWSRHCDERVEPVLQVAPTLSSIRCTDPDDQKFIDLAVASGARWLFSRDRAVLRLARRLRGDHGVDVLTPAEWTARHPR